MTPAAPIRVQCRAAAAGLLADAQAGAVRSGHGECTDRAIAKHLGCSHTEVARRFDPESGRGWLFGDVLALPRVLAREALVAALAWIDQQALDRDSADLRATLDAVTVQMGRAVADYHRDYDPDRTIDQHAVHARNLLKIATVAMRGWLACSRAAGGVT